MGTLTYSINVTLDGSPAEIDWARTLETMPKYVVSSTRTEFPWTGSHLLTGDLGTAVQELKDRTPSHGHHLHDSGLPATRDLDLLSSRTLTNGAVALRYASRR